MRSTIFLLSFLKLSHACLNHLRENVLYKIRTMAHPNGRFYFQENLKDISSTTSGTNRPTFFWFLVKHPTLPTIYRLFSYNAAEYLWEAYPKARTWNSALSNCTNNNQWIQMFNIEGDKTSNENYTRCILSIKDSENGQCFLYQGVSSVYLRQIDCSSTSKNDTTRKATDSNSVFEFYRESEPRDDLQKSCDVSSWRQKRKKCRNRRHPREEI